MRRQAIAAYALGGVALVGGGLMAYLNRGETIVRSYDTDSTTVQGTSAVTAPHARLDSSPWRPQARLG